MQEVRCKYCNKLLAKAESMNAAIKCPSCRMIFEYKVYSDLISNQDYLDYKKNLRKQKASGKITTESKRPAE